MLPCGFYTHCFVCSNFLYFRSFLLKGLFPINVCCKAKNIIRKIMYLTKFFFLFSTKLEISWQHTKTYVIHHIEKRFAFEFLWKNYNQIGDRTVRR